MIWWVAAIVCCLDQLTKLWAVQTLSGGRTIPLIENCLQLAYATNQGGAAGLLREHPQWLTLLSLVALVIIIWWAWSVPREEKLARLGFGAILGGAIGNLLDRLFRGGFLVGTYVVDFIDAHWHYRVHWPTFNLADSAICVGIAIVVIAHLRTARTAECPTPDPATERTMNHSDKE
jgi:signal peptidase II